ncbi:hypothetical protein [Streptomyces californicus]
MTLTVHQWQADGMSLGGSFNELAWHGTGSIALAHTIAPDRPGVYVYAELGKLHGLAVAQDWVYVGQGQSLSARLSRHQPHLESNRLLRDWLHRPGDRQLYYAEVELAMLDTVERDLISHLQPRFNRQRYPQHILST